MNSSSAPRINQILNGSAKDVRARIARLGLSSLEPVYKTIVRFRNRSFDKNTNRVLQVPTPVISIGNLTTGGTGKTPIVRWTVEQLLQLNTNPAIVSRGYGSKPGIPNDEFLELQLHLPATTHIQNPDRVQAATEAISVHGANCIVLDDGFQHRRISRDLNIVLIDATRPFGYGHQLPRGLLREPMESLHRADCVIITRVDQASSEVLDQITERLEKFVSEDRIARVRFQPKTWIDAGGNVTAINQDDPVVAFCGIGNPAGFQNTLIQHSVNIDQFVSYGDHFNYQKSDFETLQKLAIERNVKTLVCTVKDLVKLRQWTGAVPIKAISINPVFESGKQMIVDLIGKLVASHSEPQPIETGSSNNRKPKHS